MIKKIILIVLITFITFGCTSSRSSQPTSKTDDTLIANEKITGTWTIGDSSNMAIMQFRPDGTGCEIVLRQEFSFFFLYFPFSYTLTDNTVKMIYLITENAYENFLDYEMLSQDVITLKEYLEGYSIDFQRQPVSIFEGYWRMNDFESASSDASGDASGGIVYLFVGGIMIKLQNNIPFSFGYFRMSDFVLTYIEQVRFDHETAVWNYVDAQQEIYDYQLNGDRLTLANDDVKFEMSR